MKRRTRRGPPRPIAYDQADRATFYRQAQEELAGQLLVLFLWAPSAPDAVRAAVATIDGPLDLSVPNWGWAPERLIVAADR